MKPTCSNCKFHYSLPYTTEDDEGLNHFCRFSPPEFIQPNSSTLLPVAPDGWCGQWAMAPVKRGKAS
jgi:hypothetical protein